MILHAAITVWMKRYLPNQRSVRRPGVSDLLQLVLAAFSVLLPWSAHAQKIDPAIFAPYEAAFVVFDRSSGAQSTLDSVRGARRFSPCSTFKIYNTLIGLELGLIPGADAPWYKWDGVAREIEAWNGDLTMREAFRVSAVPAYQALARQIGTARMQHYIDLLNYGSRDISAGFDVFWLSRAGGRPILISADEQVKLLNRLLGGSLPFAPGNVAILKDVMRAVTTGKGTLYGKTGSGKGDGETPALGWFVGFLEHGATVYVFALNIIGGDAPSGKVARAMVEEIFRSQGLL